VAVRIRSWIEANRRNLATAVLAGLAATVSAAAGWDQRHHLQWLVGAAVIATMAGLTQLSRPGLTPDGTVRLGASRTRHRRGTHFAIFSESAQAIQLCLFDGDGTERRRIDLRKPDGSPHVWHRYVPYARPGQRYGYRVKGLYAPASGYLFNSDKLLLDPYARAIEGTVEWAAPVFGYSSSDGDGDAEPDPRDSAPYVPRSIVVDEAFDWGGDHYRHVAWDKTVIYNAHVRGFTICHPGIPEDVKPGSYAAMGSAPVVKYLNELGITTLMLMPVHHFVSEHNLSESGLSNYWGCNPVGYFAPEARYSSSSAIGGQVREFKEMVRSLHAANIEVILDVVFTHTAEGNHLGPHLCFRGIDNRAYYRLEGPQSRYVDYSGCGNSLNVRHPQVLDFIMDCLRYWVEEMHVDGFHLDLASALARNLYEVGQLSTFFDRLRKGFSQIKIKLTAESWDVGESGGYHVDAFPDLWGEFNDGYRDAVRDFWRGTARSRDDKSRNRQELLLRLTGSLDSCRADGRSPETSINFVTTHDGFTLHDLVSYNGKHNEANGEGNRDGVEFNHSWNCGVEGPTDDPAVLALRERQKRNFLTTMFLSAGVPLLLAGDELGRTQLGNNNAYCQDNEVSWVNWELDERSEALLRFTKRLIALRAKHPVFRRRKTARGEEIRDGTKSIGWFTAHGTEMDEDMWRKQDIHVFGMFLNGRVLFDRHTSSERKADDSFMLLFNSSTRPARYILPGSTWATGYEPVIDTSNDLVGASSQVVPPTLRASGSIRLESKSMVVLRVIA
jgi:glycogen operon protein